MRAALAAQTSPNLIDAAIADRFKDVSTRINAVTVDLASSDNPKLYSQADIDKALVQPRWGETSVEIPPLPRTGRGRKFDAAIIVLDQIAKDYSNIQNNGVRVRDKHESLKALLKLIKRVMPVCSKRVKTLLGKLIKLTNVLIMARSYHLR